MPRPYIKNVDGDFYVEDGCCITCNVPLDIAPAIFEMDDNQCFVRKQPETLQELGLTIEAIQSAEAGCIRYKGKDREILRRLVETGEGAMCDDRDARMYKERFRDHIRFSFDDSSLSTHQMCGLFAAYLNGQVGYNNRPKFKIKPLAKSNDEARLSFAWYSENFHEVRFSKHSGGFLARLYPSSPNIIQGLTRTIGRWLSSQIGVRDVCYMAKDEFNSGSGGLTPL